MTRFVLITLGMVALLALSLVFGGVWAWAALFYITVFTFFMDKLAAMAAPERPDQEFPAGHSLSTFLALVHFPLLFGGALVLASGSLGWAYGVPAFFALALFFGQVSNSNAHELIHRADRFGHRLGVAVYISLLFGHHASAHPRVHHIHAATDKDPNSAKLGEGFYAFAIRAWRGSFREGHRAETAFRGRKVNGGGVHPYKIYGAGALICLAGITLAGGGKALAVYLGLAVYAQLQLLLSDYVQHYGLRRKKRSDGRYEPVGPQHSWNAPHGFSSGLMLNAPRHSDHHANPTRSYPNLTLDRTQMPILPHSLPVMAVLALLPPVWRNIMDKRAKKWA